ncbi:MATE family efflux transporter [Gudongella sp. DL1XJH-153]|uniref:MATE family efflux transporter n=1 Tax=Gudongella sp. DL1XJH-153 TaxID=3409804 RepID=UPI003BB6313B
MKISKKELILKGNIYRVLVTLSLPIMINNLIQTLYNLVDGIWVSKISSVHFAATAFVFPVNFLFIAIGIGISVAGTSILSQLVGADKEEEAREYASQLIATSVMLSIAFSIFGVIFTPMIVKAMGGTGDLAVFSNIYLRITFLDLPFLFLFYNINSIRNAQGDTITPTILSGVAAVLNMILDPIFIFTFGWGIAGAAWATLLSRALLSVYGIKLIMGSDNPLRPDFKGFRFNPRLLKELARIGLPAAIGQSGAAFGFIILNGFIVSYGTTTMAAFGMVNRITSLIMQPAMGIGAALTAVIGQNIGARFYDRVRESFRKASLLTLTLGISGGLIMFLFSDQIVNFFIRSEDDPDVITQGIGYLNWIAFATPLMGMFSVFQGVFQGSGHTKYSMAMEIGRLWLVRIPLILVFKNFTDIGPTGIWFSMVFSNFLVVVLGFYIYKKGSWSERILTSV